MADGKQQNAGVVVANHNADVVRRMSPATDPTREIPAHSLNTAIRPAMGCVARRDGGCMMRAFLRGITR
ncbi:MAG: hypothetical protein JXQ75_01530, partial [Phycisphaerae bacterium]|nr:hypothetical protein [Phycisphaerae bacterium]